MSDESSEYVSISFHPLNFWMCAVLEKHKKKEAKVSVLLVLRCLSILYSVRCVVLVY